MTREAFALIKRGKGKERLFDYSTVSEHSAVTLRRHNDFDTHPSGMSQMGYIYHFLKPCV